MNITLKDGSVKEFESGLSVYEIAKQISEGLARAAVGGKINGKVVEMRSIVNEDCNLEILTFADDEGKLIYRHTAAHILAQAIKNVFPTVKLAIGPAIATGFYYDFDFKTPISTEEFVKIEQEMKSIIKANYPITRFTLPKDEAVKLMASYGEDYKVELINDLPEGVEISFYKQGDFVDL